MPQAKRSTNIKQTAGASVGYFAGDKRSEKSLNLQQAGKYDSPARQAVSRECSPTLNY
jgi:hypothetical protein